MPQSTFRTRFAPSPTGYLHIGGARTALFCWLFARKHSATFILRIEDTDRERSTPESIQAILDGMEWLNLDYDEGPFFQTKRMDHYHAAIHRLLEAGHAYHCVCSKERLEKLREAQTQNKEKPRYDGRCRHLSLAKNDEPSVVRFKNPESGSVTFDDLIRGKITVENSELDDFIIARSDGTPTYNFTVVIDDADMNITHVIRGDDHINNTPRQINLFLALGATIPYYAHVPMILGPDGKRLSKRHGAVSVMQYLEDGYLPQALLNYLVRLGWSHGDQEIFSIEEMIEAFSVESINNAPAAVNLEKLDWLNQHYLKTLDPSQISKPFADQLKKLHVDIKEGPELEQVILAQAERCKTLKEMAEKSRYFYEQKIEYEPDAQKHLSADIQEGFVLLRNKIAALEEWSKEALHEVIMAAATELGVKMGKLAQPLRVAVTGGTVSPSIDLTLFLIGKTRVLQRLDDALQWMKRGESYGEASAPTVEPTKS
jgi:glutamyl-tRNA synthetase